MRKFIHDKNGRFIILEITIEENPIVLVNIYAPNDTNQQVTCSLFKDLNQHQQEFCEEKIHVIIGGDYNCALSSKDKQGGNPVTIKRNQTLMQFATGLDAFYMEKQIVGNTKPS